jgi:hypothetical protein
MNRNLIYLPILMIVIASTFSLTTIEPLNPTNAQVDPPQDQIEPIPPSNNSNTDQITPMIFLQ